MSCYYVYNVSGLVIGVGLLVTRVELLVTRVLVHTYFVSCQSWTVSFNVDEDDWKTLHWSFREHYSPLNTIKLLLNAHP